VRRGAAAERVLVGAPVGAPLRAVVEIALAELPALLGILEPVDQALELLPG